MFQEVDALDELLLLRLLVDEHVLQTLDLRLHECPLLPPFIHLPQVIPLSSAK